MDKTATRPITITLPVRAWELVDKTNALALKDQHASFEEWINAFARLAAAAVCACDVLLSVPPPEDKASLDRCAQHVEDMLRPIEIKNMRGQVRKAVRALFTELGVAKHLLKEFE